MSKIEELRDRDKIKAELESKKHKPTRLHYICYCSGAVKITDEWRHKDYPMGKCPNCGRDILGHLQLTEIEKAENKGIDTALALLSAEPCKTCKCKDSCNFPERKDGKGCSGYIKQCENPECEEGKVYPEDDEEGVEIPCSSCQPAESQDVEKLAETFHNIYQKEAKKQGDVRHKDNYRDLPENIKEFDRVLARYVIVALASRDERIKKLRGMVKTMSECLRNTVETSDCKRAMNKVLDNWLSILDPADLKAIQEKEK